MKLNKKLIALSLALVSLLLVAVGSTAAYLFTKTEPVKNVFDPAYVTCEVVETFDTVNNIKTNVGVKNTSDIPVYIRAAVVVNWVDANGAISAKAPVLGTDYSIAYDLANGWAIGSDGYYYYASPVAVGGTTSSLITEAKPSSVKEGYTIAIEILAEAIQSEPASAVWANKPN